MKKLIVMCLLAIMLLATACGIKADSVYHVTHEGEEYRIDLQAHTISHQGQLYRYEITGNTVTLIYPDGSTYWRTYQSNGNYGGWSDDYDEGRYLSGDTLLGVLSFKPPNTKESKNIFLIFLLIAMGEFYGISPNTAWYVSYGWRFKDTEPSELALIMTRVSGIAAVIIGVMMIFLS